MSYHRFRWDRTRRDFHSRICVHPRLIKLPSELPVIDPADVATNQVRAPSSGSRGGYSRIIEAGLIFKPVDTVASTLKLITLLVCLGYTRSCLLVNATGVCIELCGVWIRNNQVVRSVEPFIMRIERRPLARLRYMPSTVTNLGFENINFWGGTANIRAVGVDWPRM